MNTEVVKKETEIEAKKRTAWGNMGVAIHNTEMQLQAMAQKAINSVKLPATIDEVPQAEEQLKSIKASQVEIQNNRKGITSKFDDVTKRLMEPEKSLTPCIDQLSKTIISLKKDHEIKERAAQQREEEKKRVKESVLTFVANKDYEFKTFISGKVSAALTYALGEGNIAPDKAEEFINSTASKIDASKFKAAFPGYSAATLTSEEVSNIVADNFKLDSNYYANLFREELNQKFVDYHVAYANKQTALEAARKEEAKKQEELKAEKENKELSASIEANAVTIDSLTPNVKALKKSYEVDMPETPESVIAIWAAFIANKQSCMSKLRVTKWFAFTPAQAAGALAKVKCEDNNFAPAGINFKEVDKL